ncbi:MAG: hypothetical protein LC798_10870 [Chloroflexi bacterium]|nr:hypothetical protein [Chloroflexota bacterium]
MEAARALAEAGPTLLLAMALLALAKGIIVFKREVTAVLERLADRDRQLADELAEKKEWQRIALRGLDVAGQAVAREEK